MTDPIKGKSGFMTEIKKNIFNKIKRKKGEKLKERQRKRGLFNRKEMRVL